MIDNTVIEFIVEGEPVTQGSKNPVVPRYKDGRPVRRHRKGCPAFHDRDLARRGFECSCPVLVNVMDDNEDRLQSWRSHVAWHARMAYKGELLAGPIHMSLTFMKPRPKAHYGTGRNERLLKDSAPAAPILQPDGLKLARAVEDALSSVVYGDDAQIVGHQIVKAYCQRWEPARLIVRLVALGPVCVGDLVEAGMLSLPRPEETFGQLSLV